MNKSSRDDSEVERDILLYLLQHPAAEDTDEAITEWWLLHQKIMQALAAVRNALVKLVARGFLSSKTINGRTFYRLNARKKLAIKKFLHQEGMIDA